MTAAPTKAVEVFYSYAHKDEELRNELEKHLKSLQRQGFITGWHDRKIVAGTEWEHVIDAYLNTASIILLLISPDFMASDYCYDIEMKRAMERHHTNHARVIPIILRPIDWRGTPFEKLQALPTDAKPITTWSNQDEAFLDVTRGIRAAIEDLNTPTVSKSSAVLSLWNVPHRRNPYFTGQETILNHLHNTLKAGKTAALTQPYAPQAISGLGGIGKTQIAIEYAYRHRDEYQAILWITADSHESLLLDFVALATLLNLPEKEAQEQAITVEAVKQWLDTHDRWLLIFDNADDLTFIDDFLPSSDRGYILLTTRAQALGTLAYSINVEQMERAEGALFLLRRARILTPEAPLELASTTRRTAAEEIVHTLGGLPLALDQAGAYIEETGCGLADYLSRYHSQRTVLLHRRGTRVREHPEPVATTWSLSFEQVKHLNPKASDLLQFCAFLHPDAIPEELFTTVVPNLDPSPLIDDLITLDEAIECLRAYSLVRRYSETKTLSMHRLVQAVLQDSLLEEQRFQWTQQVVSIFNHVFPSGEPETWLLCERYILHAQTCAWFIRQRKINIFEATSLLDKVSNYLKERAQYNEALLLAQLALNICEEMLGPKHFLTAYNLNNVAYLYKALGKYVEAEPLYQQALTIREQVLGPNQPATATSLNNLAELYRAQGKYDKAEPLWQRALDINKQVFGLNHPNTAMSLNNLAYFYIEQGTSTEAEPFLQQALNVNEQVFGLNHHYTARSLNSLAYLYKYQGKYEKAEPLYERALNINEQMLGLNHPNTAIALNNLAELYRVQGKYEQAEPLYQRALAISEQVLGTNHPDTASSLNNLAALYYTQGKYEQAEPLYQRALTLREQVLGANHLDTATSLNNLAELYRVQGKYEQAEPLYQRALTLREQALGTNHPDTAQSLNNLALLYYTQGRYEQAEPLYQRALTIYEQILGANHSDTATSFNNLAELYRVQGKYEQAEPFYQRALTICGQVLGTSHPDTASSLNNLATLYHTQGKYEQAESLYQRAIIIDEQVLGASHPSTVIIRTNYATLQKRLRG